MADNDPTTVIKMLNEFSSTDRRKSNVSLRLSGSSVTPLKRKREADDSSETGEVPTSPWEWRRLKGEVVSLRTRLSHQEATVQQLNKIRREMEEVFQKDKNIMEMQAELDKQTIKHLELRVEVARKNCHEAREATSRLENEMFEMKMTLSQKIASLTDENFKLIQQQRQQQAANSPYEKPQSPPIENSELVIQIEMMKKRITELEEKLKEAWISEKNYEIQKIDLSNARITIEKLECERESWEKDRGLLCPTSRVNELEKELNTARETISSMRETIKGKLLLEEQMSNLMQRVEHTERTEHQVANLEIKCADLLNKLHEYESLGIGDGPLALKREVYRLQQAEAVLTVEEGQLRSQVDALQRENQLLKRNFDESKKLATDLTTSTDRLNKLVGRLQKKVLLVTRERDNYRQQLELYEKEMSTSESAASNNDRLAALERALEDYRNMVTRLEAELGTSDGISWREECQRLREEVNQLKGNLEHRALKGDFNINARILHFKMNPAAIAAREAEEKMAALLKELEELRAAAVTYGAATSTFSFHAQEMAELKQTHEIKIARLKEAFKASSQEYRQACYQLFGWRVDRTKEGRYKLSSQYAESPDDFLFFHVGEGVDLLETAFSETLGPLVERHLKIQHSVPMFLNAVQTELFNQQTVVTNQM